MHFIPYKPPTTKLFDEEWEVLQLEHHILRQRRIELNFTPSEVAKEAQITLRQYQRFESGERKFSSASARIFLAVCMVLRLDPYIFLPLPLQGRDSLLHKKLAEEESKAKTRGFGYTFAFRDKFFSFDTISFMEYKELLLRIPKGKLVTSKMIEDYFKKKRNLETIYIEKYDAVEYINEEYPFWRVLSDTGVLIQSRFYSRDIQKRKLEEEGFEIYECGANGASLRVRNYKEYLFDLNSL